MSEGTSTAKIIAIAKSVASVNEQTVVNAVKAETDEWLGDHITNPDSPPLDRSLESSSAAAPADMVGSLKSAISILNGNTATINSGISGYYDGDGVYHSSPNYACASIDALNIKQVGYTMISGMGGDLYACIFVDANGNVISKGSRAAGDHLVDVPANTKTILFDLVPDKVVSYTLYGVSVRTDKTLEIADRPADAKAVGDKLDSLDFVYVPDEDQTGTTNSGWWIRSDKKLDTISDTKYKVVSYSVTAGTVYKLYGKDVRINGSVPIAGFSTSSLATGVLLEQIAMGSQTATDYDVTYTPSSNGYIYIAIYDTRTPLKLATGKDYPGAFLAFEEKLIAPIAGKKFFSIGDSLTNSPGGGVGGGKKWQTQIENLLEMDHTNPSGGVGLTVANYSNDSIWKAVDTLTYDADIGLISFWGGTNDLIANIELGDFAAEAIPETRHNTTFYGALFDCFEKLLTLYPTIPIFAVGTTQRIHNYEQGIDSNNYTNGQGKKLIDYVDAMKKVAEYFSIPFVDLYRTSGINKYNMTTYMYAQTSGSTTYYLHFSNAGEEKVGDRLCAFLKSVMN